MASDSDRADRQERHFRWTGRSSRIAALMIVTWVVMGQPIGTNKAAGAPPPSDQAGLKIRAERGRTSPWMDRMGRLEAVEMFLAILRGSRMEAGRGWFHPGQARHDWSWLAANHDTNKDGWISRNEFAGRAALFGSLDRDENGIITAEDLDWSDPPPLFDESFDLPQPLWHRPSSPDEPSLGTLLSSLVRGDLGSFREGPGLGAAAPDFTLRLIGSQEPVSLSQHRGQRPVVLIFGNMTCGPFRSQVAILEKLAQRYGNHAAFLAVYVREAHPVDGWRLPGNDHAGIVLEQPRVQAERTAAAAHCSRALKMTISMAADELDNRVGHAYSGLPTRLYLIDREGRVAYKSGRGPFGLKPGELEQSLVMLLMDEAAAAARQRSLASLRDARAAWQRWDIVGRWAAPLLPSWARDLSANLTRATATALKVDRSHPAPSPGDPRLSGDRPGPQVASKDAYFAPRSEDLAAGK